MKSRSVRGVKPTLHQRAPALVYVPRRAFPSTPLAAAIAAILYPASFTLAQAPAPNQSGRDELQEVVVTATRREVNVQDVPQSITAFSTADIEKYAIEDLQDVVSAVPSISLVASMPGRNAIIMRGIAIGSSEYYTDSQVAVYLDDQPLTSISQQVDIRAIDIARIESLPGPQGTLFGSSSQAGTLRYITNRPDPAAFGAQFDIEGGSTKGGEESYDASGHLNIPVTDNIAIRAVGFFAHEGGFVDNILGPTLLGNADNANVVEEDWNDFETYGGRVAAQWAINPNWESTLSFIAQYSSAEGAWETDPQLGDYKITRFFDEFRDDDWNQVSLNIKGNLGFAELSATGSYFDRNIYYEWDNALYEHWRTVYYGAYYPLYDTGTEIGQIFNDQKQNRATYEVRLTSLGESRFQWMTGAFFERVYDWWDYGDQEPGLMNTPAWAAAQYYCTYYANLGYDVTCPLPPTTKYYDNIFDKVIKQKALFGELTYALTDRWSVTGGARWFEYDRSEFEINQVPKGLPVTGGYDSGGRYESQGKSDDMVFKFSTEFHFDPDRMAYLLYSEGFRLGGKNSERAASTGLLPPEYDPDTLQNYELGMKTQWRDNSLQLNASLFLMQWNDIQINDQGDRWWVRGIFNGGKAEQKGIEVNGNWNLTRNLALEASVFLADPEFTEETIFTDGDVLPAGSPMPISPDRKYFAAIEYTVPRFLSWPGNTWLRGSWSWHSETWKNLTAIIDNDRDLLIEPWSVSNLQFGFTHDNQWDVSLNIRNVFDQHNVDWMGSTDYGALFGDPRFRYSRTLQRPRTVSLAFSKKW